MDSFELQMQLTDLLLNLSSSKLASLEICNFLIRNYVTQEDLYPVLITILPRLDINKRLNFFQFIDDFLTLITKESKYRDNDIIFNYAFLIVSDLHKILQYVLPKTPIEYIDCTNNDTGCNNEITPQVGKKSELRTLANLSFCYSILVHISELFNLNTLDQLKSKYNSNLLSDADKENIKVGQLFDESNIYTESVEPTKSSHVDDYVNSSPNFKDTEIQSEQNKAATENNDDKYIPEQIQQGLKSAWQFIIKKRKQSQYEALLLDYNEDPFHIKQNKQLTAAQTSNNTSSTSPKISYTGNTGVSTAKTPVKPPTSASSTNNQPTSSSSSSTSRSVLALSNTMILQRIEADRERQKRGKETLWEVERPQNKISKSEFDYIYDTLQAFDEIEDTPIINEMESLYQLCTLNEPNSNSAISNGHNIHNNRNSNTTTTNNNGKPISKINNKLPIHDSNDLFYAGPGNSNAKRRRPNTNPNPNANAYNYSGNSYYNGGGYYDYDYDYHYNYESDWRYQNRNGNASGGTSSGNGSNSGYGYRRQR